MMLFYQQIKEKHLLCMILTQGLDWNLQVYWARLVLTYLTINKKGRCF
ncbi:hypothetical protein ADIARSV_0640 [Arcticibacter svalbardensis MN12-7]|uniref:Uncharacterized protein n=1 Tax=Arcticibacter svalbardensis MN12-7 TaxID=1150600 RepID=R9GWE3_9SPHI|nr:hypothetical protein ADIARSV_0640 [Arcticibacter svalbardensis MN12-7]